MDFWIVFTINYHHSTSKTLKSNKHTKQIIAHNNYFQIEKS